MEDCVTIRVIIGKKWDTIKASFEPKRSTIGQEMADLWANYHWEVA